MTAEVLPCLLLPLQEKNILLPSSAIAEIIPYEKPKTIPDIPKWLLGILNWRGIHIPLVLLEKFESHLVWNTQASEEAMEDPTRKHHIAILNRVYKIQNDGNNQYPFFSIVLKNVPKLYRISNEGVKMVNQYSETDSRFIMEVKVQNDYAFIPDLPSLWKMIDALPSRLQWFRQIVL